MTEIITTEFEGITITLTKDPLWYVWADKGYITAEQAEELQRLREKYGSVLDEAIKLTTNDQNSDSISNSVR